MERITAVWRKLLRLPRRFAQVPARIEWIEARLLDLDVLTRDAIVSSRDSGYRQLLWMARDEPGYMAAFDESEPLVSVIVPIQGRIERLQNVVLPSILEQSYQHLEVIIVGEAVSHMSESSMSMLRDERVRFHNLSQRVPVRSYTRERLMHNVMATNVAMRLASGYWFATCTEDDELEARSIERLLAATRAAKAEVAYGRTSRVTALGTEPAGAFPPLPQPDSFHFSSALQHRALRFFEREFAAADLGRSSSDLAVEAMLRAGVRFTMIPDVVSTYRPPC